MKDTSFMDKKKYNFISQSIAQAEYVTSTMNCSNIVWIKKLLKGMKEEITKPVVIYYCRCKYVFTIYTYLSLLRLMHLLLVT